MVSLATLEKFLKKHKRIGLDSNILIYFIEASPTYGKLSRKLFDALNVGRNHGVCSTLALLEVLVQPYKKNNEELVNQFYGLLTTYPHLARIDLSVEIADLGAQLRARYNLKTPDAIQLATALHSGVTGFLGNDTKLKKVTELDILTLD